MNLCKQMLVSAFPKIDYSTHLWIACFNAHSSIVQCLMEFGRSYWDVDTWNEGLEGACLADDEFLVKLMIRNGAVKCRACNNREHQASE